MTTYPPFHSNSQNHEDVVVRRLLGENHPPSNFIDIGAADGVALSNTHAFYQQGWKGVVIEASPLVMRSLMDRYGDDPEMRIVNAAVAVEPVPPLQKFHCTGDLVSTSSDALRDQWAETLAAGGYAYRTIFQPFVRAENLFQWISTIDPTRQYPLLSVDVEGESIGVFMACPLDLLGVEIAIVEYDGQLKHLESLANGKGFALLESTSENAILVRNKKL